MNGFLPHSYVESKNTLLHILRHVEPLLPEKPFASEITQIRHNLQEETFRLVVLGQFKRGKSTFINALLGQPILPVDVIPTTTTITEIRFGELPGAKVIFLEGASRDISLDNLDRYIAESENPGNNKRVDLVQVFYPAPFLEDGIILVDTPGVGSIHQHNSRLTRDYLPQADAAVFLLSADPPLTEEEQQFLESVHPIIPHLFFVLNKKDYLDDASLHRVLRFNKEALESITGHSMKLIPISSLLGLKEKLDRGNGSDAESGLSEFEILLQDFLVHRRGKFLMLSNMERLLRLVGERENLLIMDMKARTMTIEQLSSNLEEFTDYMERIKNKSGHLADLAEGIKRRLLEEYDQQVREFLNENESALHGKFKQFIEEQKKDRNQLLQKEATRQVDRYVLDTFEPFRLRIQVELKKKYTKEIEYLNREVTRILQELYDYSASLFQLSRSLQAGRDFWEYESQFTYRTWEVETTLDLVQNAILTFLPGFLFARILQQSGRRKISGKLGRQCGRLRADLFYGIQENNRQFVYKFTQVLDQIENEIRKMIDQHIRDKYNEETIQQQTLHEQEMQLEQLGLIRQEVEEMKSHWQDEAIRNPSL